MAAAEAAKEAAADAARYAGDSASVGSQKAKETAGAAYDAAGDAAGAAKHKGKKVTAVRAVSAAATITYACCCWPKCISDSCHSEEEAGMLLADLHSSLLPASWLTALCLSCSMPCDRLGFLNLSHSTAVLVCILQTSVHQMLSRYAGKHF